MQWAMESMQRAGVQDLVVNTAWLGEQIPMHFGNCFDVAAEKPSHISEDTDPAVTAALKPMQMHYSQEGVDFGNALETAGGIVRALPMLADAFWVAAEIGRAHV